MTDHAGLPVQGYVPQTDAAVQMVNVNKRLEEGILRQLDDLQIADGVDLRCLATARTRIQEGFMWANRAIFQPQRIPLGENE